MLNRPVSAPTAGAHWPSANEPTRPTYGMRSWPQLNRPSSISDGVGAGAETRGVMAEIAMSYLLDMDEVGAISPSRAVPRELHPAYNTLYPTLAPGTGLIALTVVVPPFSTGRTRRRL